MAPLYSKKEFEVGIGYYFDEIGGETCYSCAQMKQISLFIRNDKKARFSLSLNQMLIDNITSRFLVYPYILFGFGVLVIGVGETIAKHWIIGGIFLLVAGFLFTTYSGTEIDTDQRLFRGYNKWFGLLKTGSWKSLDNYSGVTLVSMKKVHRMYSQSNRVNSYSEREFSIYLVNSSKKPAILLKKCKTKEQGQISLDEFCIWLKLPVFSIKNSNS